MAIMSSIKFANVKADHSFGYVRVIDLRRDTVFLEDDEAEHQDYLINEALASLENNDDIINTIEVINEYLINEYGENERADICVYVGEDGNVGYAKYKIWADEWTKNKDKFYREAVIAEEEKMNAGKFENPATGFKGAVIHHQYINIPIKKDDESDEDLNEVLYIAVFVEPSYTL